MDFEPEKSDSTEMTRPTVLTFTNPSKLISSRQKYDIFLPFKRTTTTTSFNQVKTLNPTPILLCSTSHQIPSSDVAQRSDEWFALRKDKLTTSSFSTALGFWQKTRRYELWYEKVFSSKTLIINPTAKAAMNWGVVNESIAIEKYKTLTGRDVDFLGFATHSDASSAWLGASPDGVLGCRPDGGILEVKCPYNKGKPELALPWNEIPYYYMPQVQGQMEIMDREWVEVYCWTSNGSSIFRVLRDREYWELISRILREFWFGNVIPAREAVGSGIEIPDLKKFEPEPKHELTNLVLFKSRKLVREAKLLCKDIAGHVEFFK